MTYSNFRRRARLGDRSGFAGDAASYFDDRQDPVPRARIFARYPYVHCARKISGNRSEVSVEGCQKGHFEQRPRQALERRKLRQSLANRVFPNTEEPWRRVPVLRRIVIRGISPGVVGLNRRRRSRLITNPLSSITADRQCGVFTVRERSAEPVQGAVSAGAGQVARSSPVRTIRMKASPPICKKEIATERARTKVASCATRWKDETRRRATSSEAGAENCGFTAVQPLTRRSLRAANQRQPSATFPRGLDVVAQAFNSVCGVDNDPIRSRRLCLVRRSRHHPVAPNATSIE